MKHGLGIKRTLAINFDDALVRVPEALKQEGFGVLTEIDVQDTLKKKLGVEFRRYRILGACNPNLSHEALGHTLNAGVLMPCNVVIYEDDDKRAVVIAADPMQTAAPDESPALAEFARDVRSRLTRVLERL